MVATGAFPDTSAACGRVLPVTGWLDRHFSLGWLLAAIAGFSAAGLNALSSNVSLAAIWFVIAAVNLVFAIVFRSKQTTQPPRQ